MLEAVKNGLEENPLMTLVVDRYTNISNYMLRL